MAWWLKLQRAISRSAKLHLAAVLTESTSPGGQTAWAESGRSGQTLRCVLRHRPGPPAGPAVKPGRLLRLRFQGAEDLHQHRTKKLKNQAHPKSELTTLQKLTLQDFELLSLILMSAKYTTYLHRL